MIFFHSGDKKWTWRLRLEGSEGTPRDVYADDTIPTGQWMHILVSYDGSTQKMYINNVLQDDVNEITGTLDKDNPDIFTIACHTSIIDFLNCKVDNVMIFNRALSVHERNFLWNNGNGREGLVSGAQPLVGGSLAGGKRGLV